MMKALRRRLARPYRKKAKLAQQQGRWTDALANLTVADSLDKDNPAIRLQIANMQTELGQFAEASASFEAAGRNRRFGLRAAIGLAGVSERAMDWEAASVRWEAVLRLMAGSEERPAEDQSVTPAFALLHSALCRERIGDGAGADRDLGLALALDPGVRYEREAFLMRARIVGYKNPRAAYQLLRAARRRYPADRTILFELILATIRSGDKREAAAHTQSFLAVAPDDPGVLAIIREHQLVIVDNRDVG